MFKVLYKKYFKFSNQEFILALQKLFQFFNFNNFICLKKFQSIYFLRKFFV